MTRLDPTRTVFIVGPLNYSLFYRECVFLVSIKFEAQEAENTGLFEINGSGTTVSVKS